jgi:DNA invertase Pin-like site-specific DNA recombinase
LRALLEDIAAGQINCVVVYKVDRLSRSLLDFARLIALFEERGVSLVSVTQQMNTTDSLGRLTLNILLSFAQFERELIAERTRDKMRAARRKGKWLGGYPVLGYEVDPQGAGLRVNSAEAERVRFIFQQIAEGKTLDEVVHALSRRGGTTKVWVSQSGRRHGGRAFQESDIVRLVRNVIYCGKLREGEQIYAGEHTAIVEANLWTRANTVLDTVTTRAAVATRRAQVATPREAKVAVSPTPRISRLLALALKMERMLERGAVHQYSELARLGQVSTARITQIMNLLHLAPDIQEQILSPDTPLSWLRESTVRKLSSIVLWSEQRTRWLELLAASSPHRRQGLSSCGPM